MMMEMEWVFSVQIQYSYHNCEGGDVLYISKNPEEPLPMPNHSPQNPCVFSHRFCYFALANSFIPMMRQAIR